MYRAPSPLPPHSDIKQNHISQPSHSSSRKSSNPNSNSSLSTTASTSSRTLKTPQSKLDHTHPTPIIVGSSSCTSQGSNSLHDAQYQSPTPVMPLKGSPQDVQRLQHSPTPKQRTVSAPTRTIRSNPPPMAQGPLPSVPSSGSPPRSKAAAHPFSSAGGSLGRTRAPPPPLNIKKKESRLSQDWVHLDVSRDEFGRRESIDRGYDTAALTGGAPIRTRLPEATMIPMRDTSSPRRPTYERASTAPTVSPVDNPRGQAQKQGRGSLDQLRSASPPPFQRPRKGSLSTPPALILESAGQPHSTGGRLGLFRSATAKSPPQLKTRRSEDVLRPSVDSLRAAGGSYSKKDKDTKVISKEQRKALGLGVSGGVPMSIESPPLDTERKISGLSLKKSSGALKALFNRGASGKGKEKVDTPPVPIIEKSKSRRPSTAPKESSPASFGTTSPALGDSPLNDTSSRKASGAEYEPGRRSLGVDRSLYPAPSLARTQSQGSHPVMMLPTRQRLPSRDLPRIPPPSPIGVTSQEQEAPPRKSGSREQIAPSNVTSSNEGDHVDRPVKPQLSLLADALPTSSLPYLSPLRASFLLEKAEADAVTATSTESDSPASFATAPTTQTSSSSASSSSTFRPSPNSGMPALLDDAFSPLKTSQSLHLLQLPELDLNFDFAFDTIGGSPSTPRRTSPQKGRNRVSPGSPTPQRSLTTRHSPRLSPKITRANSDRRRSQSFDGSKSPDHIWTASGFDSPDITKLFASAPSSSAPLLSSPLIPTPSGDSNHTQEQEDSTQAGSVSSHHTALSSISHVRTPSNASSTNETASPSPPKTPDDKMNNAFSQLPPLPIKSHNAPPSIPLPALPDAPVIAEVAPPAAALSLAPAAVIEELKPIKSNQPVVTAPREYRPVLTSRSVLVSPDPAHTVLSLATELGRLHAR